MNNNRICLSMVKRTGREQQYIQETFDINRVIPLEPSVDAVERELGAPATA